MGHRRLHPSVALAAALLCCTAFIGLTLWYRVDLHGFPWDGPGRLSLCGRYYVRDGPVMTLAQLDRQERATVHLYPAAHPLAPLGPEVYADASPAERAAARAPGEPCAGALYTQDGSGYQLFALSGSP